MIIATSVIAITSIHRLGDARQRGRAPAGHDEGLECEVILSEEVYKTAGLPVNLLPEQKLAVRGRAEPMIVRVVANARMLSSPRSPSSPRELAAGILGAKSFKNGFLRSLGIGTPAVPANCSFAVVTVLRNTRSSNTAVRAAICDWTGFWVGSHVAYGGRQH